MSDTSPILNLAILGQLRLLRERFGEVIVPPAVLEELKVAGDLPGSAPTRRAIEEGWLKVEKVHDTSLVEVLRNSLDRGEAEAIALALQVKPTYTLLDEREARKAASGLGLRVTGVLGVLLQARLAGTLPSLSEALEKLRVQVGFRISERLVTNLLKEAGERD